MFQQTFNAYAEATYLNSEAPWKYVYVQTAGDQIYVGLSLLLAPKPLTTPQARVLEALFLESQITVQRTEAATKSWLALTQERQEALGSMAASIRRSATVAALQGQSLQPTGQALANVGADFVLSTVRSAVASTNIPQFDEVVRLVYEADVGRLHAGGAITPAVASSVKKALTLAVQFDSQRSLLDRSPLTPFGSYKSSTESLLKILNLIA